MSEAALEMIVWPVLGVLAYLLFRWWFGRINIPRICLALFVAGVTFSASAGPQFNISWWRGSRLGRGPALEHDAGYYVSRVGGYTSSLMNMTGDLANYGGYWLGGFEVFHIADDGTRSDVHTVSVKAWADDLGTWHCTVLWDGAAFDEILPFSRNSKTVVGQYRFKFIRRDPFVVSSTVGDPTWDIAADGSVTTDAFTSGDFGVDIGGLDYVQVASATTQPTSRPTTLPTTFPSYSWIRGFMKITAGESGPDTRNVDDSFLGKVKAAATTLPTSDTLGKFAGIESTDKAATPDEAGAAWQSFNESFFGFDGRLPSDPEDKFNSTLRGSLGMENGAEFVRRAAEEFASTATRFTLAFTFARSALTAMFIFWFTQRLFVKILSGLAMDESHAEAFEFPIHFGPE